jgi:hypothetical protein
VKLVDMKRTAKDKKTANAPNKCEPTGRDSYPYSLTLHLGEEELSKLGIDKLPSPGKTMTLQAKCKVISTRSSKNSDGSTDSGLEIQLQRIGLTEGAASAEEALSDAIDGDDD